MSRARKALYREIVRNHQLPYCSVLTLFSTFGQSGGRWLRVLQYWFCGRTTHSVVVDADNWLAFNGKIVSHRSHSGIIGVTRWFLFVFEPDFKRLRLQRGVHNASSADQTECVKTTSAIVHVLKVFPKDQLHFHFHFHFQQRAVFRWSICSFEPKNEQLF